MIIEPTHMFWMGRCRGNLSLACIAMVFVLCSFEIAYGTEWKEHALTETFNGPVKAVSVDMDNDGDYDVLALSFTDQSIVWFENENGRGQYSNRKLLAVSEQGFYDV